MDQPYLSWCLVVRNCEATLEATLKSLRERTPEAEIVIVDTCSSDGTVEIAKRYADVFEIYKGPRGDWDETIAWVTDMAAARQRSFDLASGHWIGWADGDDRIPGAEEAEQLLKLNGYWKRSRRFQKVEDGNGASSQPVALEDWFRALEKQYPEATCVWAPYLYQRDENDAAIIWQDRERFIRNDDPPKYRWSEAAHEILVPIGDYRPPRVDLAHLLFVHEKDFSDEAYYYSTSRHFDVMLKLYEQGGDEITTRRCLYLAAYAPQHAATRELEFLTAAHASATNRIDRTRALVAVGNYYITKGLYSDASEHFGAAQTLTPDMPDPWYAAATAAAHMRDHVRAVQWFERGIACEIIPGSEIAPRHHEIRYPTLLCLELQKLADAQIEFGAHAQAERSLARAVDLANRVKTADSVGHDKNEALDRWYFVDNKHRSQLHAMAIHNLWQYLVQNDETAKAVELINVIPHNLQDHPLMVAMELWSRTIVEHMTNPQAYVEHYNKQEETGFEPAPAEWLNAEGTPQPRVPWIAEWINTRCPNARVLDYGCNDGLIGIPLLQMCPNIDYYAAEIADQPIDVFKEHMIEHRISPDRVSFIKLNPILSEDGAVRSALDDAEAVFDVIIWTEVIEHVPDPVESVSSLRELLAPEGRLMITTPWGSYDAGRPCSHTKHGKRDPRGHLRAMTARDVYDALEFGGCTVETLYNNADLQQRGVTMHVRARAALREASRPVAFAVPSALWDWNGRSVHIEGMGASEECIVYMAEQLAPQHKVDVFGPVPQPEVLHDVGYWPRPQLRHVDDDTKIVVSRGPTYYKQIDERIGEPTDKILWLQDAYYPELNADVANEYESIVVVSEWHKQAMHDRHGVPLDKMHVIYNFLLAEHFKNPGIERKRDHFIYASSPDRGLTRLLRVWPRILAKHPNATLNIFYGWKGCQTLGANEDSGWTKKFQAIRAEYDKLKFQPGVHEFGLVDHRRLAHEFMLAGVWGYHTAFEETGCLSASKARAGGAVPVTSALAALNETAKCDQGFLIDPEADDYDDQFVEACFAAIDTSDDERQRMSEEAIETYRAEVAASQWRRLLK